MRVNHGRTHITVTQQLLHRANVVPVLEQVRGEGVPEGVTAHVLGDLGCVRRALDSPYQVVLVYVVAADRAGALRHRYGRAADAPGHPGGAGPAGAGPAGGLRGVPVCRRGEHAGRRPAGDPIDDAHPDGAESPLEAAVGRQGVERYEAALASLKADDRELVIARVELGLSYPEIALSTGRASANAARMAVVRALVRLSEALEDDKGSGRT